MLLVIFYCTVIIFLVRGDPTYLPPIVYNHQRLTIYTGDTCAKHGAHGPVIDCYPYATLVHDKTSQTYLWKYHTKVQPSSARQIPIQTEHSKSSAKAVQMTDPQNGRKYRFIPFYLPGPNDFWANIVNGSRLGNYWTGDNIVINNLLPYNYILS